MLQIKVIAFNKVNILYYVAHIFIARSVLLTAAVRPISGLAICCTCNHICFTQKYDGVGRGAGWLRGEYILQFYIV
jgi:hypothetical protein